MGEANVIQFATTPGSQITVVNANNGGGKTSILRALSFVLYGSFKSIKDRANDKIELTDFANRPALLKGGEIKVGVKLQFEFEGKTWILERSFSAKQSAGMIILGPVIKSLVEVGQGAGIPNEKIDDFVNDNLINQQVSHFYFFDGYLLEEIQSQLTSKDEVSRNLVMRSVENALGLRFLDHLKLNLKSCLDQTDAAISAQQKALDQNSVLLKQIASDVDAEEALKKDIESIQVLLDVQVEKRDSHDARLLSIDPETKLKAGKRIDLIESLKQLEEDAKKALENIRSSGEKAWLSPLSSRLADMVTEQEAEYAANQEAARNSQRITSKVENLRSSLEEKSCALCGHEHDSSKLADIQGQIDKLQESLKGLPPIGASDRTKLSKLNAALRESENHKVVDLAIKQHDEILIKIAGAKRKIGRINDELGDFQENINVKLEEAQRASAVELIEKYEGQISRLQEDLSKLRVSLEKSRLKVVESDSVSKKDQDTRKILSILITAIDDSFESFKGEMRAQVQEKATEYLQVLTSEPEIYGSVAISPNYQIGMLTPEGKQLQATNAGHRQMLTTAFVSAMAAVSSEKTPFVMDTALSHLDPANSKKMLEWTKYVDQQVVLLVQPKELPADVAQRELGSAIGRKYEVTKTSAEVSEIKETV
jgi:DNA sulfur modification protein DndD